MRFLQEPLQRFRGPKGGFAPNHVILWLSLRGPKLFSGAVLKQNGTPKPFVGHIFKHTLDPQTTLENGFFPTPSKQHFPSRESPSASFSPGLGHSLPLAPSLAHWARKTEKSAGTLQANMAK